MDGAAPCAHTLRAARTCLAAATALALALVAPAPASASSERFGVNAGGVFELAPEARDRHLRAMAEGGLGAVRVDAAWVGAEPEPPDPLTGAHRYRWATYDAIAGALARHGLRWYPVLDYSTRWSGRIPGDLMSPPADPAQFAAYARAFAARYGESGAFWAEHPDLPRLPVAAYEIWNEPNAEMFWRGQATAPEDYAELYLAARRAIREVDAATPVVTGGLLDANATEPSLFLLRMLRHRPELVRAIDAVGYHPYQQAYAFVLGGIERLRRTMAGAGMGATPIEVTEIGATTAWVAEGDRAEMLGLLARDVATGGQGVGRFMPFTWLAPDQAGAGSWGIVRSDGSPLPTATAYLAAVRDAGRQPPPAAASTSAARRLGPRLLTGKRKVALRWLPAAEHEERRMARRSSHSTR
jgi:hypothetical protein